MRNLLGRLHARPAGDLPRIAAFWQAPLGNADKARQIGLLYRVMVAPGAVRDVWERLDPDAAALVRLLAAAEPEAALTLAELGERLTLEPGPIREVAIRLFRGGVLARTGDAAAMPPGEHPRLFLPRELAVQFRRVIDEIDLGDQSKAPLAALLAWLDDGELEEAAAAWGSPSPPGAIRREDVTRRLLRQTSDPARIDRMATGPRKDAAAVWRIVRDSTDGAPVALHTAMEHAGLAGDSPRAAARRRAVLEELERSLLVWHTYRADGSRWLFAPAEIRSPRPRVAPTLPPLDAIADELVVVPRWQHPDALAWDLLTLLQEISTTPWLALDEPSRARLHELNNRFWQRGAREPPAGYLPLLLALAEAEGLTGASRDENPIVRITPELARWRQFDFSFQTQRLREHWLDLPRWVEARDRDDVDVRGVEWKGARRRLLALLADPGIELEPGRWVRLDSLAARIAAHAPRLLGGQFTAATARFAGDTGPGGDPDEARAAAVAEVVIAELSSAFVWFGFLEVSSAARARVARVTAPGAAVAAELFREPALQPGGFWRGGAMREREPDLRQELPPPRFRFAPGLGSPANGDERPAGDVAQGGADQADRPHPDQAAAPRATRRSVDSAAEPDAGVRAARELTGAGAGLEPRTDHVAPPAANAPGTNKAGASRAVAQMGQIALDITPPLEIEANGLVLLHEPTPIRVWTLDGVAAVIELGNPSRYQLSARAMRRALTAGARLERIVSWLERQNGTRLPPELAAEMAGWTRTVRRVRLRPLLALELDEDDPAAIAALRELASTHGWSVVADTERRVLLETPDPSRPGVVLDILSAAGFGASLEADVRPDGVHTERDEGDGTSD